jgi:hypothetical protein
VIEAVLFDFTREDCKLGPLLTLVAQSNRQRGSSSDLMCNDLMGC